MLIWISFIWAASWENRGFAYAKTKMQISFAVISFAVTAKLISIFVFITRIVLFPLLHKYKISSLLPSSVAVQPGLCQTWLEIRKNGFLRTRLILFPGCGHCKKAKPEFMAAAAQFKDDMKVMKVGGIILAYLMKKNTSKSRDLVRVRNTRLTLVFWPCS